MKCVFCRVQAEVRGVLQPHQPLVQVARPERRPRQTLRHQHPAHAHPCQKGGRCVARPVKPLGWGGSDELFCSTMASTSRGVATLPDVSWRSVDGMLRFDSEPWYDVPPCPRVLCSAVQRRQRDGRLESRVKRSKHGLCNQHVVP